MISDRLREQFLKYHAKTKRHISNRDKALVYCNGWRDRFYLTPTSSTLVAKPNLHYEPKPDTSWEFVLYSTSILTVDPDDTATINLNGWYTQLTYQHLSFLLTQYGPYRFYIERFKPNKWTDSTHHLVFNSRKTPLFDGLRLNLATSELLNPKPIQKFVVGDCPEVREIRSQLMRVKKMYLPLANLHKISWNESKGQNDPFKDVQAAPKTYEELVAETEPSTETYAWLAAERRNYRWYGNYNPVAELNRKLQKLKDDLYRQYLVLV